MSITAFPATRRTARREVSHRSGFWITAAAFLISMAYSTVPTPLWALYQQRDGFSTFAITIAFAAYAVGVVLGLFFIGHLGDTVGRRRLLLPAIGLEIVSAVMFILWSALPGLIVARVISGIGIGMLTATITAHIIDLHLISRPGSGPLRGQIVAGAANLGGFGVGAFASGVLASWFAVPLVTPYVVFLVLLVAAFIGVAVVPETAEVPDVRPAYRPQQIRVPRHAVGDFLLAGAATFGAFAVLGLFTSLAPGFLAGQLHITNRAIAGAVVLATFGSAAVAQIAVRALTNRAQVGLGGVLLVTGLATVTLVVVSAGGLEYFLLGGALSGGGAGVLFKASLAVAGELADASHRGEVLAGIFLSGYLGLTVPVVGIGVATLFVDLPVALLGFATVIIAITVAATVPLQARLRRPVGSVGR